MDKTESSRNILKRFVEFIKYWYLRYSLVTELYMVEPWERVVIQIIIVIAFFILWWINYTVLVSGVSKFINFIQIPDQINADLLTT